MTPPQNPPLKPAADFKLIGKSLKRLDTPDKVNGKAVYGIDALPPGREDRHARELPGIRRQGRACQRRAGQDHARGAAGHRSRRSRRGRRRPHVGRQAGPRRPRHHVGRRAERRDVNGRCAERSRRRKREKRRGREIDRRCRQGSGRRNQARRDLPCSVPRARADGADELHRARSSRRLRDLGRQSGHHPRSRDRSGADGPAASRRSSSTIT